MGNFLNDDDYEDIEYSYHEKPSPHIYISRTVGFKDEHLEEIYEDGRVRQGFDYDGEYTMYDAEPEDATMTYVEALRRYHEQEKNR